MTPVAEATPDFEYIIVGSGAGGGPLAANLARRGAHVLLLEAGSDCGDRETYRVPGFHGLATEDPEMSWEFFVRHYEADAQQKLDSKHVTVTKNIGDREGVFYPRAGTLGGCTAHNAMITIVPHDRDWDDIAESTGDPSWSSERMRVYFERLECCQYTIPRNPFLKAVERIRRFFGGASNPGRHGSSGWLTTNMADVALGLKDPELVALVVRATKASVRSGFAIWSRFTRLVAHFDPNDWIEAEASPEGLVFTPLATREGCRTGARDYVVEIQKRYPDRLTVRTESLVTRVLFDDQRRAIGVEYMEGAHLYRASPTPQDGDAPDVKTEFAKREVILAGGAFNSPQLLKLSGIGPRAELEQLGIPVVVDLPGVGENLQDRYEVGVIYKMKEDFKIFDGAAFVSPSARDDAAFHAWQNGAGVYTSNGAILGIIKRSSHDKPDPDLFIFGLPSHFRGYYPGYSRELLREKHFFTWAILKAHTTNTAGQVTLRSTDPREEPNINFRYFGNDKSHEDLQAVTEGVKFVREIMRRVGWRDATEVLPGDHVTGTGLDDFVRKEAWGHHASCSNKIGPASDPLAVVDSRFRVHGVRGLRVVDASVFPRIPGFFIVTAVYMISEKAADVLLEDAVTLA